LMASERPAVAGEQLTSVGDVPHEQSVSATREEAASEQSSGGRR
jgi:hypothetical protein